MLNIPHFSIVIIIIIIIINHKTLYICEYTGPNQQGPKTGAFTC